jgi:FAD synthase
LIENLLTRPTMVYGHLQRVNEMTGIAGFSGASLLPENNKAPPPRGVYVAPAPKN